jgi:hypothetical protein
MRVERLAALAIAIVVASAGLADAAQRAADNRTLHAQAAQPGPASPPADQHPPAAQEAKPPAAQPQKEPAPQPRRARAAKPKPKPKREPIIDSQECTWVGKRTIRVLMRDDLIAADGFLKFYRVFGCPVQHLGKAFGCSLIGTSGAPAKAVEERVDVCWKDPEAQPATAAGTEPAPQAAPPAKPAAKPAPPKAAPPPPKAAPPPKPAPPPAKPKPEPETAYPKR